MKQQIFKLAIVTDVWKRPEIFEVFAQGVENLKGFQKDWEVHVVVAGSEGSLSEKMVRSKGFGYVEVPNSPLGRKMNAALQAARELNPTYCLLMGSDDIVSPEMLRMYLQAVGPVECPECAYDFYGVTDFYFYDLITNQAIYWGGYDQPANRGFTCGAGRMISNRLLDIMNWQCWDNDIDRKLDTSMQKRLSHHEHTSKTFSLRNEGVMAVDIKTLVNRTPFARWPNTSTMASEVILDTFPFIRDLPRMKISANIATYQPRVDRLHEVIDSLIDQVDVIRIYCNNCEPPREDWLARYKDRGGEGIIATIGLEDLTDNGKFYSLDKLDEPEYYFTCDDDLIYPPDYVSKTIRHIENYQMIVSYHGRKLIAKDVRYYEDHKFYHCLNDVPVSKKVDVCGTGVSAFRTDYFHPKGIAHNPIHRMSDLLFSLEAAKQGKKLGVFEHAAGWFKFIDYQESIFNTEQKNGQDSQIELANQIYELNYGD